MEKVGHVPKNVVEIGLKPRILKSAGKDIEDIRDCRAELAGIGQRTGIGFAGTWPVAVKLHRIERMAVASSGAGVRGASAVS